MAVAVKLKSGEMIDYTPSADVAAGDVIVQGSIVGIALSAIPANTLGALAVNGVFRVPKLSTDAVSAGAVIYWDSGNNYATISATSTTKMGYAVAASASGVATVDVLLGR